MEDSLRKMQIVELNILKKIVEICEKNNLRYYMLGGTLLGAIRHQGFIPWDDDIDIGMPRKDYEKFLEIMNQQLPENWVIDNYMNNPDTLIAITRIEDSTIKIIDRSAEIEKTRYAWVDILPMDGMPKNAISKEIHKLQLLYCRLKFKYSIFSKYVNQKQKNRPIHEKILIKIGQIVNFEKVLNKQKCIEKMEKKLKKYSYDEAEHVVDFMGAYKFKEMFPKKIYDETCYYQFEDMELVGPKNYEFVLKQLYGNYMKIPEDAEKNRHCIEIIKE